MNCFHKIILTKILFMFICTIVHINTYAEDAVIYYNSSTGRQTRSTGTIENYSRYELTLRTTSGNILSIKTDNIIEVQAERPALYNEAEQRMNNREFYQALPLLEKSLPMVSEEWMKQEILARQIECLYSLNRVEDAAQRYVQLVRLAPDSAFYDCVPLVWTSVELSSKMQQMAQNWIRQQNYPYVALLGASFLLTSDKKNEAQTALAVLTKSDDSDVAALAQLQLNRLSLTPLPMPTIKNLEMKTDALPKSLQFGPRFVLAQLWSRSSAGEIKTDKAAINYLQCATNSKAPVEFQARAYYSAGSVLLSANRRDEAFRVFNRLIDKCPDSQWSQQAKRTIDGGL